MQNKATLGTFCIALGLVPAAAVAHTTTFSGTYLITENRICDNGMNALVTGSITFTPMKGTARGTTTYDIFTKWLLPNHPMEQDIESGTFEILYWQNIYTMTLTLWDSQKLNLTFGRVDHGIAHSAVALGYTNGCTEQATLHRVGS